MFAALARSDRAHPTSSSHTAAPDSYWHGRADGAWGSFVVNEVIAQALSPAARRPEAGFAIGGISMGGFGAAGHRSPAPWAVRAVGGHSAALWVSGGESAAGAFDDAPGVSPPRRHPPSARAG